MKQPGWRYLLIALLISAAVVGASLYQGLAERRLPAAASAGQSGQVAVSTPTFVGRSVCAGCHAEQDKRWQGSHHDLAMQEASETSVLGNFNAAEFNKDGVATRFFRENGRFKVRTDGPDGQLADFEIKYTFGVTPLQQYLIELPGGRLQALSVVWDSRPGELGGQRWFHLYPNETIDHNDPLHWTKRSQNWNFMCAECHSTHFQKNYDPTSHSYRSAWSEIDVSCEACHGPGSRHAVWAENKNAGDATKGLVTGIKHATGPAWEIDPTTGNAMPQNASRKHAEIEICARCHSRRAQLFGDYHYGVLLDSHLPALLTEDFYHADGQIDGEVYEYGSFLQSKMYHAGVACTDCHEPHSLKTRLPGNALCGQCHSAAKYQTTQHHFHQPDQAGGFCVDCHMPGKTYMGVDTRRDHGFRIPRPDLSERLGTPNACNACHADKSPRWAAEQMKTWYGKVGQGFQRYAEALHAGTNHETGAGAKLQALLQDAGQPAIARATALAGLADASIDPRPAIQLALQDSNPLVRRAGLELLEQVEPAQRWALAHEQLQDPVRSLRILAAAALAPAVGQNLSAEDRMRFERAGSEYMTSLQWNADDPSAHVNLGNYYSARNQTTLAEQAYRAALAVDPNWLPAYINWAEHLRINNRDTEAEAVLRQGLQNLPKSAALHHSLGLLAIRQKQLPDSLDSLRQAVMLDPEDARYSYVYSVLLFNLDRREQARLVVKTALNFSPDNTDLQTLQAALGGL